jgi:hypothetical protein
VYGVLGLDGGVVVLEVQLLMLVDLLLAVVESLRQVLLLFELVPPTQQLRYLLQFQLQVLAQVRLLLLRGHFALAPGAPAVILHLS